MSNEFCEMQNLLQKFWKTIMYWSDYNKFFKTYLKQDPQIFTNLHSRSWNSTFPKKKPKVVLHRQYKNVCNNLFRSELENTLSKYDFNNLDITICIYTKFLKKYIKILDKYAPLKRKYLRANYANFMNQN